MRSTIACQLATSGLLAYNYVPVPAAGQVPVPAGGWVPVPAGGWVPVPAVAS
jgi:hypothetical protein